MVTIHVGTVVAAAAFTFTLASNAVAQSTSDTSRKAVPLSAVTITATRTARSTFDTPLSIAVLDSALFRERLPHGPADLFRDIAGLDVSGVGPNQRRPEIRGLRGQRVLLLEDGLRLNNARRQQDFGEIPSLAGIGSVERVEVVRGPASVLYGTDAIGGVVNLISQDLPNAPDGRIVGQLMFRYGSAGDASTPSGSIAGRFGRLGLSTTASYRDASNYRAPAGKFGNVNLNESVIVNDSRIRDRDYRVALEYELTRTAELFSRAEFYSAAHAGFGFVDPAKLGPNEPKIQILYPDQDFSRYTLGYRASRLTLPFANRAEVSAYAQRNERHLRMNIFVPIAPTANVSTNSFNFTDLATIGGRLELAKTVGSLHVLTYGMDVFRDKSTGTDSSRTVVTGFGPPSSRSSNTPAVPNARFRSAGAFAQLELHPIARLTTVFGARLQDIVAETRPTLGITMPIVRSRDRTGVWSANALYSIAPDLNAVASVGRGFRAPNLVERFFEGAAPEGNGFQKANASLGAETSINVDLGVRHRHGAWYTEAFVFRNEIDNAIKAVATGDSVNRQAAFQNRNVGRLRLEGLELVTGARTVRGLDASLSFTRLLGRNVTDPGFPVGDSYSSKIVGDIAYRLVGDRFSVGYTLRHQGEQKDVIVGTNPIGAAIPAFTVHSARASVRIFDAHGLSNRLTLTAENLGDKLYAEFPNASFFRPEPGRSLNLALSVEF